jgi:hypothetical protein
MVSPFYDWTNLFFTYSYRTFLTEQNNLKIFTEITQQFYEIQSENNIISMD